ncbi:PTS system, cellobiose-specific IIA component [Spiroplasma sp. TIUS-1]|uniref:PTS lactose/cellobiose transporter subunit IIA n=1 Tax=Spiroplasma sp. TIUS-1 TaxID=216963 RepID=UPI00139908A3|nr:PTS lactose/cellobiose transporter subunit IIA [Spiroplasma sp. TIUS-1]QHX35721.1 PTS system, cellobiose-specific IIA component [Spiroplasma sp. TIUS-1]
MSKINFEEVSFQIIAFSGDAKGAAMSAIYLAKEGKFKEAEEKLSEADGHMNTASHTHMDIVSAEASGEKFQIPVLFMHAEDQLLSTQTIMLLAKEFVEVYKKIGNKITKK